MKLSLRAIKQTFHIQIFISFTIVVKIQFFFSFQVFIILESYIEYRTTKIQKQLLQILKLKHRNQSDDYFRSELIKYCILNSSVLNNINKYLKDCKMSISNIKCDICVNNFDQKFYSPRVCNRCGHSVCDKCLVDIYTAANIYRCPFCKSESKEQWPRNHTILSTMEVQANSNLCTPHKRKAVSLCSNPDCNLPVAICDMAECSKPHKERGTNNLPLALVTQNVQQNQAHSKITLRMIELFYIDIEEEIVKIIRERKQAALSGNVSQNIDSKIKSNFEVLIQNINACKLDKVTSKDISNLKKQILSEENNEELEIKSLNKKVIIKQKEILDKSLSKLIESFEVDYFPKFKEIPKPLPQKSTKIKNIALTPEFEFIKNHLKAEFNPVLLFSSNTHNLLVFKPRLLGQSNLFFRVQLTDGNIFGSYIKRSFPKIIQDDQLLVDPAAFFYWYNQKKIYPAAVNSVSQYDVSPDYLLSIGNTYNYDGLWFKNDFNTINHQGKSNDVVSNQYKDLKISLKVKTVKVFQMYQLDFIEQ